MTDAAHGEARRAVRVRTQEVHRYRAAPEVVWDLIVRAESARPYLPHVAASRYFRGVEGEAGAMRYEVIIAARKPAFCRAVEVLESHRPERIVQRSDHGVLERTETIRLVRDGEWTRVERAGLAVSPHPLPSNLSMIGMLSLRYRKEIRDRDDFEAAALAEAVRRVAERRPVALDGGRPMIALPDVSRGALTFTFRNEATFDAPIELVWRADTDLALHVTHRKEVHAAESVVAGAAPQGQEVLVSVATAPWGHIVSGMCVMNESVSPHRYSVTEWLDGSVRTTTREFQPLGDRTRLAQRADLAFASNWHLWPVKAFLARSHRATEARGFAREARATEAILEQLKSEEELG